MFAERIKGYDNYKLADGITEEKLHICDTCGDEIEGRVFRVRGDFYCEECLLREFEVRGEW